MLRDGTAVWIFRCFLRDVVMRNRLRGSRMGMAILAIMAKTLEGTYTKVHHPCNENRPSCCREGGAAETPQADKFGNREPGRHAHLCDSRAILAHTVRTSGGHADWNHMMTFSIS